MYHMLGINESFHPSIWSHIFLNRLNSGKLHRRNNLPIKFYCCFIWASPLSSSTFPTNPRNNNNYQIQTMYLVNGLVNLLNCFQIHSFIYSLTHACFISINIYWVPNNELDIGDLKMSEMLIMPVMSLEFSGSERE